MKQIPVFLSRPLRLTPRQRKALKIIEKYLAELRFEPHTVDAPVLSDVPIVEIHALARICSGGVILGFIKHQPRGPQASQVGKRFSRQVAPTPWNQVEAGMLYSMGLPLLIFREPGVTGGVFDMGSTDVFLHDMPTGDSKQEAEGLKAAMFKWGVNVRAYYYRR